MYQLLVKSTGWDQNRDNIESSRVFEYTDGVISNSLKNKESLDLSKLQKLPALFMTERNGDGPQIARVGYINRLSKSGKYYQIEYDFDPDIPEISIDEIKSLSNNLYIHDWEFSRTHWAIKDVDLFKILLSCQIKFKFSPTVFSFPKNGINNKLISVMMPFDKSFDDVYSSIKKINPCLGFEIRRADDIWKNDVIMNDVVSLICRARIIICDCTDRNPNVFYETGIAHSIGKNVILITQSRNDIPFDLNHLRYIPYLNNNEGLIDLRMELEKRISGILTGDK